MVLYYCLNCADVAWLSRQQFEWIRLVIEFVINTVLNILVLLIWTDAGLQKILWSKKLEILFVCDMYMGVNLCMCVYSQSCVGLGIYKLYNMIKYISIWRPKQTCLIRIANCFDYFATRGYREHPVAACSIIVCNRSVIKFSKLKLSKKKKNLKKPFYFLYIIFIR